VFVPIRDENPLRSMKYPVVNYLLILANVAVFALEQTGMPQNIIVSFAVVPAELLRVGVFGGPALGPNDGIPVPESYTLFTYMFFHGDIFHIAGNMLFLWVFGDNVEDALGHVKYLLFYIACGITAGLTHAYVSPTPEVPLIGASGAVAGVIAAYLLLHPHVRVWILAFRFIPLRISAMWALGAWILSQLVMVAMPQAGPVAWWAHIGGLVTGAILVLFLRRPGVPLLGRDLPAV
jgi:membrane associated rhomboid family serine protease